MNVIFESSSGYPAPLGAQWTKEATNFSIYSRTNSLVLSLFKKNGSEPFLEYNLDPVKNRTGRVWHICLKNLPASILYGFRVADQTGYILDPYAKATVVDRKGAYPFRPLGVIVPDDPFFDWENDKRPEIPRDQLIIYEMHVRGFTQDESSGVSARGTFQGLIEKIPHLVELGINAVELQPVQIMNESEKDNYWGYSTLNFFSLTDRYSKSSDPIDSIREFKTLVRELHKNGIEVILDIVLNHTSEGNEQGPVLSFKALAPEDYYILSSDGKYHNYSGCGNTLNCNNPVTKKLLIDCLRYWVSEMHVDGFRFDLASVFLRDEKGAIGQKSSFLEEIEFDPILSTVKLIAEPWDIGGYSLGQFTKSNINWQEWNDKFRDSARRFFKGDAKAKGEFAASLCGSVSLFGAKSSPSNSINFITAHDGFTLRDLVSYNQKHNEENGENNRDGSDNNLSWNCGYEGEIQDEEINRLRDRQIKNMLVALVISRGIPMILMGDEYGHSRNGNNNPWNQDNGLNWFSWKKLKENSDQFKFLSKLIELRKRHPLLNRNVHLTDSEIEWHGKKPNKPNWWGHEALLHFTLKSKDDDSKLNVIFNPSPFKEEIELPDLGHNRTWKVVLDTFKGTIHDENALLISKKIAVNPFSSIVLNASSL